MAPRLDLRIVNHLQKLEELHMWPVHPDDVIRLTLPKLKTFRTTHFFGGYLVLDSPQLINLSLNDHFFKLVHQTIETF